MNPFEVVLTGILPIIAIILVALYLRLTIPDLVVNTITDWIGTEENQEAIRVYSQALIEQMKETTTATIGGILSGISRGAQSVEGQMQHQAIAQATGNPIIAGIVSKYIGKYPLLGAFIQGAVTQGVAAPSGETPNEAPRMT